MLSQVSNEEYHADPAISASQLHAVAQSPLHYYSRFVDPNRPRFERTAAMMLGTLVHCAVLEPDELDKRFAICPPRNTKAGKERAAEMSAAGIEAVTESDYQTAIRMRDSVFNHPAAKELFSQGKAEQSFWWDDATTGQRCKCRPDWYFNSTIVDLKTTQDASPQGFAKSVAHWRYHVQQVHYQAGTFAERFLFVAVEKSYPYAVGVYELDADAVAHASELRLRDLLRIKNCRESSFYTSYDSGIKALSLPRWALNSISINAEDF